MNDNNFIEFFPISTIMSTTAHYTSRFRNSCVKQPRNPTTKLPTTVLERESLDFASRIEAGLTNASSVVENVFQTPSSVFNQYYTKEEQNQEKKKKQSTIKGDFSTDQRPPDIHHTSQGKLKNLINDDDKFFSHLQALKAENKKTLRSLEKLYNRTQYSVTKESCFYEPNSTQAAKSKDHYVRKQRRQSNDPEINKRQEETLSYSEQGDENDLDLEQQEALENLNNSWKECRRTICESPSHVETSTSSKGITLIL